MEAYKSGPKRAFMDTEVRGWTGTDWVYGKVLTPYHLSILGAIGALNETVEDTVMGPIRDGHLGLHDSFFILDISRCALKKVEAESLGESTCYQDTAGRVIFEGDIVCADGFHPDAIGLVYRNKGVRGWPYMVHLKPSRVLTGWPEWMSMTEYPLKVLGTWSENRKELLGDWNGTDSGRGEGEPLWQLL